MLFRGKWRNWAAAGFVLALGAQAWGAGFPDCPQAGSPDELQSWKETAVHSLINGQGATVSSRLDACFQQAVPACIQRAVDYSANFALIDSVQFGTQVKDDPRKQPPKEIISQVDASNFAVELRGDLEQIAKSEGWPMVRYKSRYSGGFDQNTPSLLMIRVPGDKMNPPVDYDRYLNIPLPADTTDELNPVPQTAVVTPDEFRNEGHTGASLPRTFTIVTVKKKTDANPSRIFFARYVRSGTGETKFTPLPPQQLQGCYECHASGLREISPLGYHVREGERQMPPDMWKATQEMNASMEINMGYVTMEWGGALDPSTGTIKKFLVPASYGPVVGPLAPLTREEKTNTDGSKTMVFPTRTREAILGADGQSGCAHSRTTVSVVDIFNRAPGRNDVYTLTNDPPIRWEKVRDAMKCAGCHNNKQRGGLNSGLRWGEIDFKVLVDQSMPYGWHRDPMERGDPASPVLDLLNPNERIAVANCLQAEWGQEQGKTLEWLNENSCRPAQ